MDIEFKEEILEQIRIARDNFRKERFSDNFNTNLAWYYIGVFDTLIGLYTEGDVDFPDINDQPIDDYLEDIINNFFKKI